MTTATHAFIEAALDDDPGMVDLCRELMDDSKRQVVKKVLATYPHMDKDVIEAVWETGTECFLEILENSYEEE